MILEKGIPLPARAPSAPAVHKYPLRMMEVGESFLVLTKDERNRIKANAAYVARTHGRKFVTRKVEDGYRIWRMV